MLQSKNKKIESAQVDTDTQTDNCAPNEIIESQEAPVSDHLQENIDNNENEQQEQPQNELANDQNNENQNDPNPEPAGNTIASLISSVSNSHLMSEDNIEAIREVLCKKENVFYRLSPRDENLQEELLTIIKTKAKIAENTIGQALNYYHQKLLDSELNHLDKLMKILKSNKREMYLRRLSNGIFQQNESDDNVEDPESSHPQNENEMEMAQKPEHHTRLRGEGVNVSLRDLLPEYDPQRKYIRFQLNDKYEVYLKGFEEKSIRKASVIDKIPQEVLQNHILVYFNSFDLFKIRAVCSEWRELIRGMWHLIFRREMMEQVIAADLCNDIEMNFKLMGVKSPFYQKFGIFMKAISEIIEWDVFLPSLQSENVDLKIKMLVMTFFRMIGMYVGFEKLSDYSDLYWDHFKDIAANHLKTFIDSLFHQEFQFKSNFELDIVKENFLDCPDISSFSIRQLEDKNAVMFQLFLRQLLVFAQLKNFISVAQSYIILAKDKLKEVSKEWPHKKDFLEGAYKILLFKFIEIKDGEVAIVKEDNERRSGLLRNIQEELDQCVSMANHINDEPLVQNQEDNTVSSESPEIDGSQPNAANNLEESKEGQNKVNTKDDNQEETLASLITNELNQRFKEASQNPNDNENQINDQNLDQPKNSTTESEKINQNLESNQIKPEENSKCAYHENSKNDDLEEQLAKILELKSNASDQAYEKFLKSQNPDYVIKRNGSETRLYLDNMIKIEFLIQKVLRKHILRQKNPCTCQQESTENNENHEESHEDKSQTQDQVQNSISNKNQEFQE